MQLKIGNLPFAADTTFINRSLATLLSPEKIPYGVAHNWTVAGFLLGDGTQANLVAQQNNLLNAIGRQYQDLTFYANDGSVAFRLPNAGSTSGVIYTNLTFPGDEGAEFATKLKFSFTAEATYPYAGGPAVLEFSETLEVTGGGPRNEWIECNNALPVKAEVTPHMPCRVVQSGESKALGGYRLPGPLFPGDETDPPAVRYTSPKREGTGYWAYSVAWTYIFGGATRIDGRPNLTI